MTGEDDGCGACILLGLEGLTLLVVVDGGGDDEVELVVVVEKSKSDDFPSFPKGSQLPKSAVGGCEGVEPLLEPLLDVLAGNFLSPVECMR